MRAQDVHSLGPRRLSENMEIYYSKEELLQPGLRGEQFVMYEGRDLQQGELKLFNQSNNC